MSSQHYRVESGLRDHRTEFIREDGYANTPADPTIEKYSNSIQELSWAPDASAEPQRSIGRADPTEFVRASETHEITLTYNFVKWFTDGSGNPNGAAYDGVFRSADNLLPNSHTFVDREDKGSIAAQSTVSGNTARPTRIYTVGRGGLIDEVAMTGDPSDASPIRVELSYVYQKVRSYQIDQPTDGEGSTLLTVTSSSADDTTQTVTIEDEGANTTEDVALNGTSVESTSSAFSDIDAINLSAETQGDITVAINTGSETSPTEGDALCEISGKGTYRGEEGDLGVPALGAGTREDPSTLGDPASFIGDQIDRGGTTIPHEIPSATLTVANNVETTTRASGITQAVHPGNREISLEADMYGESQTHDMLIQHLETVEANIDWYTDLGTLTLENAALTDPGERAAEEGQAVMSVGHTFQSTGISQTAN